MYLGCRMCDVDLPQDGIAIICEHNACSRDVGSALSTLSADKKAVRMLTWIRSTTCCLGIYNRLQS